MGVLDLTILEVFSSLTDSMISVTLCEPSYHAPGRHPKPTAACHRVQAALAARTLAEGTFALPTAAPRPCAGPRRVPRHQHRPLVQQQPRSSSSEQRGEASTNVVPLHWVISHRLGG